MQGDGREDEEVEHRERDGERGGESRVKGETGSEDEKTERREGREPAGEREVLAEDQAG